MIRPTIRSAFRTSVLFAAAVVAVQAAAVSAWATDPTPTQIRCQWKKHRKAGRYQSCVQDAVVEKVKDPLFDLDAAKAACAATFETAWELQETRAADAAEECLDGAGTFGAVQALLDGTSDRIEAWLAGTRWVDNGDGTATDSTTGLQWELKTDDGGVHDKDDKYVWCTGASLACTNPGNPPDGTAFTEFLAALNGSADGNCFAGKCDWRLPTIEELQTIVDTSVPDCSNTAACTTIPGLAVNDYYWSSSTFAGDASYAHFVDFYDGASDENRKVTDIAVRAVRGGL